MDTLLILLLLLCFLGFVGLAVGLILAYRKISGISENETKDAESGARLEQSLKTIREDLYKTNQHIGSLQTINKKVDDISNLFFSQKLRGNFGERVLKDMLEIHFPKGHFELQYRFKDGQVVDAILKTKDGLISVDSKFPADSYRRMFSPDLTAEAKAFERNEFEKAVRKHITDIAKKYILPGEGTAEFAIMYVPSEAIFYEIISTSDELSHFAGEKHVMMTSPNTMSYYLHILRLGQERTRIEQDAQKVWSLLSGLQQDFTRFGEALRVSWTHVTNAKKTIDAVGNDFSQLSGKIEQIKQLK